MKIMVGAPVRNRAWILPSYIEALGNQNMNLETCFVVNDCTDDSEQILVNTGLRTVRYDVQDSTKSHVRGNYSYNHLAELRNVLLDEFLKSDCDYLFSCDTDIVIPDGGLQQLVLDDVDVVSMIIKNSKDDNIYNFMMENPYQHEDPKYDYFHPNIKPQDGLLRVDVTGAVYLIKREVVESGVRYGFHVQGEDIHFSKMAGDLGFKLFCDTRVKALHFFDEVTRIPLEV